MKLCNNQSVQYLVHRKNSINISAYYIYGTKLVVYNSTYRFQEGL